MQFGCTIPDECRQELVQTYKKCRFPPVGEARFAKALGGYRNGIPYYKESEITWMTLEEVPAGEEITQENTTIERVYADFNQPVDVCGNCGAGQCDDGSKLKRCAGCKER
jgi:hypothetical protein